MPIIQPFENFPVEFVGEQTDLTLSLAGNVAGGGQSPAAANLRLKLSGDAVGRSVFVVSPATPILPEIEPESLSRQIYTARLLDHLGDEILISDASIDKPAAAVGEKVSITVGKKILDEITPDKTYTFQIGVWDSLEDALGGAEPEWTTVLDGGKISSRQFRMAQQNNRPADVLSFEAVETKKDRLNRLPMKNYIFYDRTKTTVETQDIEKIYDSNGDYIRTQVSGYNSLTFYKILEFVCGKCGFSSFESDVPNFPLTRADFSYKKSYREGLNGICGMYEPRFFYNSDGNVLRVKTKFVSLPEDFEPESLTVQHIADLQLSISQSTNVAGVEISYIDSTGQASASVDEVLPPEKIERGEYGDDNYSETRVVRTYRKWFDTSRPFVILDRKLIREVHSTYDNLLNLTDRETTDYSYDAQARALGMTQKIESTVPDLDANPPAAALLTTKTVKRVNVWTCDARNPRRQYMSKIITQTRGLIGIDSQNQAIGASGELEDYKNDFEKIYEHGNLTADMTSEFGPIETVTKTLTPTGSGQWEWRIEIRNDILGKTARRETEPATGDPTLNGVGGRARQFTVWCDGVGQSNYVDGEIIDLSGGEVPFGLLEILANIIIDRRINGLQDGTVQIPGWHKSLDRGTYFTIRDRDGSRLARVIAEGVQTTFSRLGVANQQTVMTTVQISEV